MDTISSKKEFSLKTITQFVFDQERAIYTHPDNITIEYQDGGEAYILESMRKVKDLSSHSTEFNQFIKDWPSRYHFSNKRINFLEAIKDVLPKNADVLEIGSGCGTITRWLGEQCHSVDALEGNVQRAGITRYRTMDLDNVTVYCGDVLATSFDKKYDIITMIGSLEYIPLYDTEHDDPKEACTALLTRLNRSLKENGIILIAIENKFGAKYFSGCKEDHTGREFEGVIGYPDKTPVTFSRNELEAILSQSEFRHNQFYHVFPDYKLTESIIPENPEVISLHPYNWIRTPFEDYSGTRLNLFPDMLFLKSITDSGLLWQFSNSFVIVASPGQTMNLTVPWLIKKYRNGENLDPKFYHEIFLIPDPSSRSPEKKFRVHRLPLTGSCQNDRGKKFEFKLISNEYVSGELFIFHFYSALVQKTPEDALKHEVTCLHNHLQRSYSIDRNDPEGYPLVKGEAIDFTFWNLVMRKDHIPVFIDKKWKHTDPLPIDVVLFRNLFNIFEKISPFLKNKNKQQFILEIIQSLYPQYSETRLFTNLELERTFQSYVSGKPQYFTLDSAVQYSLGDKITQNNEMTLKIDSLTRSLGDQIAQNNGMASKIDSLTRSLGDQIAQNNELASKIDSLTRSLGDQIAQNNGMASKIDSLTRSLGDQIAQNNELASKIDSIEHSIVWQFAMKFHTRIVERLLPQTTRRRRYYDLGRDGGKILINNGYHAFYQSAHRHFIKTDESSDYQKWIKKNEPSPDELNLFKTISQNYSYRPKISIITPVWNIDKKWLCLAIDSVINQVYDNWELCLIDGGSTKPHIKRVLNEYAQKEPRIKVKILAENRGIAGNSNEGISLATGEFIGFLDHDDELAPFALHEVVSLLNQNQNFEYIYSDEDKLDQNGNRKDPFFKPDWLPDLFLSQNYLCHLSVIRKTLVDSVGGFHAGYDGSQDYDLFLRCTEKISPSSIAHIPKILYHWRIIPGSAADYIHAKPYAITSAKKALKDALLRRVQNGDVTDGIFPSSYRIRYAIQDNPLVSIIVPTKDHVDILKRCVQSILDKTLYKNYEIVIVDNQSTNNETFEYYASLKHNPKIKILYYDKPFNFSAINNYAAAHTDSPYILFLNNDTEVISDEWLSALLEHAQRECVGAVGAQLLYPNNLIQHAGVILGITGTPGQKGVAGHSHKYLPDSFTGYFLRPHIIGNYSAVTAACLMMRKDVFKEVGGFDEDLAIAFNDVDLCLRIRSAGFLILYTPYSRLYHHESVSRGYEDTPEKQARFSREVSFIRERWGAVIDKGDPCYNPNLSLEREDFSLKKNE